MIPGDEYPILALGATMTALGLASARPRDVLVVEASGAPAPEFAGAFYAGDGAAAARTGEGADLEKELKARNILADGRYHVPALLPVLYQRIRDAGLHCLFWTDTVGIEASGDAGYTVDLFNASGHRQVSVGRVVDTTSAGMACGGSRQGREKRLWAMLHGYAADGAAAAASEAGIDWKPGRFANESYLGLRLEPETDWPDARRRLLDSWRARPEPLAETRIAAIATEFDYSCPREPVAIATHWIYRPSVSFADPLAAFDGGVGLATEEWA